MQISRTSALPTPPIRAVRKSEWLRCALDHHFNPDPGVDNEIVVLATGIDQYLQEIFHHLAFYNHDDVVSDEDFRLLCLVLGITTEKNQNEGHDICNAQLPPTLNFREFHSRLCGFFTVKAQSGTSATRLPVTEETEHVEREIRLRWPRVRRRKCASFDLSRDLKRSHLNVFEKTEKVPAVEESGVDRRQRLRLEHVGIENASLRELVEDLRSALQSSDARCMALEVALRRGEPVASGQARQPDPQAARAPGRVCRRRPEDLLRELELVRTSRDGQLEEAMRFNQRLEEELAEAYAEASRLGAALGRVRRESAAIKRRTAEARRVLAAGLERVRDIQSLAGQVGPLQERVRNLETELQQFRSHCTCRALCEQRVEPWAEPGEPTGQNQLFISGEEGLQRAVEGRAASDEEEEETNDEEEQCCLLEVKWLINRLHKCAKGCQRTAVCQLLLCQSSEHQDGARGCGALQWQRRAGWRRHTPPSERGLENDMQQKQEEVDGLWLETQMVESERVHLSMLEEKLTNAVSPLLQLRDKKVSRRALGKLLLDTLDLCSSRGSASIPVFQVADILCQQLTSSEHLYEEDEGIVGSRSSVTPDLQSSMNHLIISC